jgi:hypothetical protein
MKASFGWKQWLLLLVGIVGIQQVAGYLGKTSAERVNRTEAAANKQEIRVLVSRQDAEGVTQKDFSLEFLKVLETYSVERVKKLTTDNLAAQGLPPTAMNHTAESNYVEIEGLKLAVIRIRSDYAFAVTVMGIVGKELIRVNCLRAGPSPESIPIASGQCAEKINEVFKIKIGGN